MPSATLAQVIAAFINCKRARALDAGALSRLDFWNEQLGSRLFIEISVDEIDVALAALIKRGRLRAVRNAAPVPTGLPLKGSTVNRYLATYGELFKFARRERVIPRAHPSPLIGLERSPEPMDPDRYLNTQQIEKLIAIARVIDVKWGRMVALILTAYVTGIRVGNLMALPWERVNLDEALIYVGRTKNGDPIAAPLTQACVEALRTLPKPDSASELVFRGRRADRPHGFRRLWARLCVLAGFPGRNFHQVRHGTGTRLAIANVNQAGIMAAMGHRTLSASRRYMHHNTEDRRGIIRRAFGE